MTEEQAGKQRARFSVANGSASLILDRDADVQQIANAMGAEIRAVFERHLGSFEWDVQPVLVEARAQPFKSREERERDWEELSRRHEQLRQELAQVLQAGRASEREQWKQIRDEPLSVTEVARGALLRLIHELSFEGYRAEWMRGVEFDLWDGALNGPRGFGLGGTLSPERCRQLWQLARMAGGWWRWDDEKGEVFVTLEEWEQIVAARVA